jgi:drug/metabolite transporter (DMT)-like permease
VPGTLPGFLGVAAFGGIKFVGYSLAASGLKKFEPVITSSATKIAAVRTGLGFILGPLATVSLGLLIGFAFSHLGVSSSSSSSGSEMPYLYALLFVVRIFVWALVLFLFTRKAPLPGSSLWLYAFLGAIVSSLLDWPGYALAIAAPGQFAFC